VSGGGLVSEKHKEQNENHIYGRLEMKLSWREVRIFGLGLLIPVFVLIAKKLNADHTALLQVARGELAGCARCHKLLSVNAGMSFILHLQDAHKIEADDSYEIISDVYRRMGKAYRERATKRKSGEHRVEVTAWSVGITPIN
jgi:hypothetical protein